MTEAHPDHEAVAAEVRSWYTDWPGRGPGPAGSVPDIGIVSHHRSFGHLRDGPGRWDRRVVLTLDDPGGLGDALRSAEQHYGTAAFDVWVDDRARAAVLEPGLVAAGFRPPEDNTVVLALVGPLRSERDAPDHSLEVVNDETGLRNWSRVKLMAFANSEDEPSEVQLQGELNARRAEQPIARCELAFLDGQPAGILAHYTASSDQMVFLLGTRVPFRGRGLAQSLLSRWAQRASGEGARSLLINCDEYGTPGTLYRRMGFADEIYWHRRYRRATQTGDSHDA